MSCLGVLFSLTPEEESALLCLQGDDDALRCYVQETLEPAKLEPDDPADACDLGKAWDALHRCLGAGPLVMIRRRSPGVLAILGGRSLHRAEHYIITLKSSPQATRIASHLAAIAPDELRRRFNRLPSDYGGPADENDRESTVEAFVAMREFYNRAAAANRAVIFTADQ